MTQQLQYNFSYDTVVFYYTITFESCTSYSGDKRVLSTREIYQFIRTFTVDGCGLVLMNFNDEQNIGNLNNDLYYILKMIMN